jgi:hypothetical protein
MLLLITIISAHHTAYHKQTNAMHAFLAANNKLGQKECVGTKRARELGLNKAGN